MRSLGRRTQRVERVLCEWPLYAEDRVRGLRGEHGGLESGREGWQVESGG